MQTVMVIFDGMQDMAYPELQGRTPREAGRGDAFARLERESRTGRLLTTPHGYEAETQTAILTLLGVTPPAIPHGRSWIEALAQGIEVGPDDIIMRCNFVEVSPNGILTVPCCNAPQEMADALRGAVAAQPHTSVTPVGGYKSLQKITGAARFLEGLVTSAPHMHAGENFETLLPYGNELADRLALFSRQQLEKYHPYTVLNWGAAVKTQLPSFASLHGGHTGGLVTKTDAPIGIAAAMGMECPVLPSATGDTDTDIAAKLRAALDLATRHDFVMLHVGGPDEATHRQDPVEKAEFLARLDAELLIPLMEALPNGARVMVTSDHVALCSTAGHTEEPVEFWLWEKGTPATGALGTLPGEGAVELMMQQ